MSKNSIKKRIILATLLFSTTSLVPELETGRTNNLKDVRLSLDAIISQGGVVLIDFFADWCAPCRNMNPVLTRIAHKNGQIVVIKVNIEDHPASVEKYNIRGLPTLLLFKNGILVERISGYRSEKELQEILNTHS